MDAAKSEKARHLQLLAKQQRVPFFTLLARGESPDAGKLDPHLRYIVRGCLAGEDQKESSLAGQGLSIGPIGSDTVNTSVKRVFAESSAIECIVQVFCDGPSGVLFCLSPETAVLEYANIERGVTSGKVSPFVAVFPNTLSRYNQLANSLPEIYREFGPCNVEIINPEDPSFVQLRPITSPFDYDYEFWNLKMNLQELEHDSWLQDEFCHDLAECPEKDETLIELFCNVRSEINQKNFFISASLGSESFIKIGGQLFIPELLAKLPVAGSLKWIGFGAWLYDQYRRFVPQLKNEDLDAQELMRTAVVLRLYQGLFDKLPSWILKDYRKKCFELRILCRRQLWQKAEKRSLKSLIVCEKKLKDRFEKDGQKRIWKNLDYLDFEGTIIVEGPFSEGPWCFYEKGMKPPESPSFLVTDQLFPDIFSLFPLIKGIICEGGATTSHLAILAREQRMPLWIQVQGARKRFIQSK